MIKCVLKDNMKRLLLTLLTLIASNSAFAQKKVSSQEKEPGTNITRRREFFKGLAGLAGAGICGYLSYNSGTYGNWRTSTQNITYPIYKNTANKIFNLMPRAQSSNQNKSCLRSYCKRNFFTVGHALIALVAAQYGIKKLTPIVREKIKELTLTKST